MEHTSQIHTALINKPDPDGHKEKGGKITPREELINQLMMATLDFTETWQPVSLRSKAQSAPIGQLSQDRAGPAHCFIQPRPWRGRV